MAPPDVMNDTFSREGFLLVIDLQTQDPAVQYAKKAF